MATQLTPSTQNGQHKITFGSFEADNFLIATGNQGALRFIIDNYPELEIPDATDAGKLLFDLRKNFELNATQLGEDLDLIVNRVLAEMGNDPDAQMVLEWLESAPFFSPRESLMAAMRLASQWRKEAQNKSIEEQPSRFKILSGQEVKAFKTPESLIQGLLYENTTGEIVGGAASYKTFIAMGMAESIAGGHCWNGRATKQVPVLYVSGEGRGGLGKRIAALEAFHQRETQVQFLTEAVQLHQTEEVEALVWAITRLAAAPGLIVIDTLARCFVGGDENSAKDAGLFIAGVDRIRAATGATVLVLHHLNKTGEGRGSTAFNGAFDTVIEAKRENTTVTLRCIKQKDADEFEPMSFARRVVEFEERDEHGNNLTSLVFEATDAPTFQEPVSKADAVRDRIIQVIGRFPEGARKGELVTACSFVSRSGFYSHLKFLEESGKVTTDSFGVVWLSKPSKPSKLDKLDGEKVSNLSNNSIELDGLDKRDTSERDGAEGDEARL